jgi:hypothetical protein
MAPVDYDLDRLGSREFEHLTQVLAMKVLGTVESLGMPRNRATYPVRCPTNCPISPVMWMVLWTVSISLSFASVHKPFVS